MSDYSAPASPDAFDELEDVLYDADPAPDLADELAAHAVHSPLLYAAEYEPGYDLQEYHSDWEYYSDDYYDDDPSILRTNPIDGSPIKSKSRANDSAKTGRSRKRKLADRDSDIPPFDDDRRYLQDCMKGTVWAQPVPLRDNFYQPGQSEAVALLKDWRSRFGTASPKKSQSKAKAKPQLSKDESWANDLGLADMGLLNARGSVAQAQEDDDEDEDVAEGEADEGDYDEPEEEDLVEMGSVPEPETHATSATLANTSERSPLAVRSHQISPEPASSILDEQPNKRRKRDAPASAPDLPSPPATNGSIASRTTRRARSRADSTSTTASAATTKTSNQQQKSAPAPEAQPKSRKRKASPMEDEELESVTGPVGKSRATAPTASSRAKRVASSANSVVASKNAAAAPSGPARATRSRKK